jgi:AcrR family transcriptional regulator
VSSRDQIADAACAAIQASGVAHLTIANVGRRAGVSSALVHYHFHTKQALLAAAAERLAARRTETRTSALLSASGLAALDALWSALAVGQGLEGERSWNDLALLARRDTAVQRTLTAQRRAERAIFARSLPGIFADLGAVSTASWDETAALVLLFLDGLALALAEGSPEDDLRAAYDAFWLVLVSAGQARQR